MLRCVACFGTVAFLLPQTLAGQASPSSGQTSARTSQPARDAPAHKIGTGVVRGRVVADGSDPAAPVPDARIFISSGSGTIEPVFSDAGGRFEITALPAGRYTLTAEKTGFAKTRYGARNDLDATIPVEVSEGNAVGGVEIRMPTGAAITGRITDELGDPVVGALVAVAYTSVAGRETSVVAATSRLGWTTDDRGEYRIGGLPPGRYVLVVYGANEGSSSSGPLEWSRTIGWVTTYYAGAASPAAATPIALHAGEERSGVDFTLVPARPAKLTLSLTDQSGAAISGVILLTQPGITGTSLSTANIQAPNPKVTVTLQPGDWIVSLVGAGSARALAHITLGSGEEASLPLIAGPGARISGRVVFSGSTPPPSLGSVSLRMRGVGPDARSPFSTLQTTVKADASFEMSGLLGSIVLQPGSPIPGWTLEAMRSGTRDLLDEPLALSGTENISDIELVFSDRLGRLSGTTVDDRGAVSLVAPSWFCLPRASCDSDPTDRACSVRTKAATSSCPTCGLGITWPQPSPTSMRANGWVPTIAIGCGRSHPPSQSPSGTIEPRRSSARAFHEDAGGASRQRFCGRRCSRPGPAAAWTGCAYRGGGRGSERQGDSDHPRSDSSRRWTAGAARGGPVATCRRFRSAGGVG